MKGIAHFISAIATATFVPDAVYQATAGSPVLALGGIFGLLPDTLDFRLVRYVQTYTAEIDPSPHDLQPQAIAERVAAAIRVTFETGVPQTIMLHTIRLGPDLWREYSLRFSPSTDEIIVHIGPVVNTSQAPIPGSEPTENVEGKVSLEAQIVNTCDAETKISVFSGPAFRFERQGDRIHVTFLPWHRRWTHSLTVAASVGLVMALLVGPTAGLVSGLGFSTHVLQDQLGYMGSNLFWPITRRRTTGLGLLRSGDALPNSLSVWLSIALILFNLDRFSATPRLPPIPYLLAIVLFPIVLASTLYKRGQHRARPSFVEALRQGEIAAEADEVEL